LDAGATGTMPSVVPPNARSRTVAIGLANPMFFGIRNEYKYVQPIWNNFGVRHV
jgi:hypothetical protein